MSPSRSKPPVNGEIHPKEIGEFSTILSSILPYANLSVPRSEFLNEVSKTIVDSSGCDAIELLIQERGKNFICEATRTSEGLLPQEVVVREQDISNHTPSDSRGQSDLEWLSHKILTSQVDRALPTFTENGSFWTGDCHLPIGIGTVADGRSRRFTLTIGGEYRSLAMIPFVIDEKNRGLLQLKSKRRDYFSREKIEYYEGIALALGHAASGRRAQVLLRERVKELTCLYRIAHLSEEPSISLEEILRGILEILPPSWLYPEAARARILLDGHTYVLPGFQEGRQRQRSDIIIEGVLRGAVEVIYVEEKPEIDEGPFLKEERDLIDAVAREIGLIVERRKVEEDKLHLRKQLRHADRLATIGQLAAGVAHELNEPLGNILGFAQLAKKAPGLPEQTQRDIDNIISASLKAREIIRNLLLFSRQKLPEKSWVNVNQVIEEGLGLLKARCSKAGITLKFNLVPELPEITADQNQLQQVLVNLVVNAIQAMPDGGQLTIETRMAENRITLAIEDTGMGMSDEVRKQLFMPFFTTKDIGLGTGLGLSVVHGIVTAHGGMIHVTSEVGHGTRFQIELPIDGPKEGGGLG